MKKKMITVLKKVMLVSLGAMLVVSMAGCGKELSNEYVKVKQYKGLEVTKITAPEVTDEQIEQTIQSSLNASATKEEVTDRASKNGDWVTIDYVGYIDDEAFENGSAQDYDLELGSGTFLKATEKHKGFEEQLEGHKAGDEFDITVQFPSTYENDPTKADQVARFHIVLKKVFTKAIPELTDEWVKKYTNGDSETVEEYRESLRESMEESSSKSVETGLKSSVQQALYDQLEIKSYPEDKVQEQVNQVNEYYSSIASMYGLELTDFVTSYLQMTEEEYEKNVKDAAQQSAAVDEAMKLIAEKEKLTPTDEEYEEAIAEYASEAGMEDTEAYKEQYGEDALKLAVLRDVVTEFLVEHCVQVEESSDAE